MIKIYEQINYINLPKRILHIDLYVEESKNRPYIDYNGNKEDITYIMILAVPKEKKEILYKQINNARCLSPEKNEFDNCKKNCKFHCENDGELHYTEIQKKNNVKFKIADRWLEILLNNNFKDDKSIYFNILGIIESNLDIELFGDEKQFGNIYCRFFRSCLLRLLKMFKDYDEIIVDNIFHDKTTEMEMHPYFNTNAIKKIRIKQLMERSNKISFATDEIIFIDSDHNIGDKVESQFIQFVDIILGATVNTIHNIATNSAKIELSLKIKPLIDRILSSDNIFVKKKSKYNYFNKQSISYFPIISKQSLGDEIKQYYTNGVDLQNLLEKGNFFANTKPILLKEDTEQLNFFNL